VSTDSNVFPTGSIDLLSAGQIVPLPFRDFLQEMEVEIVSGGAWTATLKLFDDQGDRLEKIIIAAGRDRDINFQWGWDDPNVSFQREFAGSVLQYTPEFMPHGVLLNLEVCARSAFRQVIDKKIRSFAAGLLISDIVRQISDDRGWTSIIEDTDGAQEQPFNTKGESDFNFIKDTLRPHAVNANGSDFVCRFDEEDTFHFHSPGFQGQGPLSQHTYRYARDVSGDVIAFMPQDNQLFGVLYGGGNSLYSSPNSGTGGQEEQQTDQGAGLAGGGAPAAVDASSQIDMGPGIHSFNNIIARDPLEVERLTKARYAEMRRYAFKANLRVHGTHRARVHDYIQVDYTKQDGTPHYLSGNFQIFKIKHVVGVGLGWTTEFELLREGTEQLPGTTPITVSQTIQPTPSSGQGGVTIPAST
jgi:hypothetical protein